MKWAGCLLAFWISGATLGQSDSGDAPQPGTLPFQQALETIVARNPQVAIQKNSLEITQAKNLPSHLALLPNLSLQATQTYNVVPGVLNEQVRTYQATTQFNLFRFGADVSAIRAAGAEEDTQKHLIGDTVLNVEAEATKALVAVIQAAKNQLVLRKIAQVRKSSVEVAQERYQRGLLALQEVNKVTVDSENAASRLADAEMETVRTKAQLTLLLGHPNIETEWPWKEPFYARKEWRASEPDLSQRPDWQAAKKKAEGARFRKGEMWGKFLPSLDLNLSYGLAESLIKNQSGPIWVGNIALTIPLFDKLSGYGNYRAQVATEASAEMELVKIKRQARAEWESSEGTFQTALDTAKARDKTVETSRRIFDDNFRRFRQGLVSANELVFDADRLYNSELFAIKGWANAHETFIARCHAEGLRVGDCLSRDH